MFPISSGAANKKFRLPENPSSKRKDAKARREGGLLRLVAEVDGGYLPRPPPRLIEIPEPQKGHPNG
jgi:hypothetical protein